MDFCKEIVHKTLNGLCFATFPDFYESDIEFCEKDSSKSVLNSKSETEKTFHTVNQNDDTLNYSKTEILNKSRDAS